MNTLPEILAAHAATQPEREAIRIGSLSICYRQLWQHICRVADWLGRQAPAGARVLLPAEKRPEMIVCYFAAHLAGLTNILIDSKLNRERMVQIAQLAQPALSLGLKQPLEELANLPWPELEQNQEPAPHPVFPPPGTVADLMFTTGTTGTPKGVLLTQGNLLAAATNINTFIGNGHADVELVALPLCHSFGMGRVRCQLLAGGTSVIIPHFGNERKLLRLLEELPATGFAFVPSAWHYLHKICGEHLRHAGRFLKYIEIGSAALPLEDKKLLMEWFPRTRICMHYGLTEASRSTFIEFHRDRNHLDSVGKATPGVDVAVFSSDGQPLPQGEMGEIGIRGGHVMPHYLEGETNRFSSGFFRTGDMGSLDKAGYLHLAGRLRELINTGGKKVAPSEVEAVILQHPAVRDCACTAIPDPEGVLGELVKAHIVYHEGAQAPSRAEWQQFLRGKLEPYKIPSVFASTERLPRTESGKLQRLMLH